MEKIGFIRQQFVDGFHASEIICSSTFKRPYEDGGYELFQANFLSTFGPSRDNKLVKVICASVNLNISKLGTENLIFLPRCWVPDWLNATYEH